MPDLEASTSNDSACSDAICAFINDKDNLVIRNVIDHLDVLESGCLSPIDQDIATRSKLFIVPLDTKYYFHDVPIWVFPSFEAFAETKKRRGLKIYALIICASRSELTEEFMARVSQCSNSLNSVEVMALVLKDNPMEADAVKEITLNKFAISRGVEIINIANTDRESLDDSDDGDEGTTGIARLVEAIETVRWPGLRMKQDPIGQAKQRTRLLRTSSREAMKNDAVATQNDEQLTEPPSNNYTENCFPNKSSESNKGAGRLDDYPDTDDEEAILEWFDRPLPRMFAADVKKFP